MKMRSGLGRVGLLALLVLTALAPAACGKKGDPVLPPPQTDTYPNQYPHPNRNSHGDINADGNSYTNADEYAHSDVHPDARCNLFAVQLGPTHDHRFRHAPAHCHPPAL